MRGRRGPPALPDRRRALEPLAHRKPRWPDVLQALRRASRLARHPRRSLYVRELRTAHHYILVGLAIAQPSDKLLAAINLTSMQLARAIPTPTTAALALTSRALSSTITKTTISAAAALAAALALVPAALAAAAIAITTTAIALASAAMAAAALDPTASAPALPAAAAPPLAPVEPIALPPAAAAERAATLALAVATEPLAATGGSDLLEHVHAQRRLARRFCPQRRLPGRRVGIDLCRNGLRGLDLHRNL